MWPFRKRATSDRISFDGFPFVPADYEPAKLEETLRDAFTSARMHTMAAIADYGRRAGNASGNARMLRGVSVVLFVLGTMAPIVANLLLRAKDSLPGLSRMASIVGFPWTELGYVLLAIAGGAVLFDQFFGESQSWMRYRQAEASLKVKLVDLNFRWAEVLASGGGKVASPQVACRLLEVLRAHAHDVEALAQTETEEWAARFRAQIDAFDKRLQAKEDERAAREARRQSAGALVKAKRAPSKKGGRPGGGGKRRP